MADADALSRLTVALLAVLDVTATTCGIYDLPLSARRGWHMRGKKCFSPPPPLIVSRDGKPLRNANGVRIAVGRAGP